MLEVKKNHLETQYKGSSMNVSALSLNKKINTIEAENQHNI